MLLFNLFIFILCIKEAVLKTSCDQHVSCQKCIQDPSVCVWCTKEDNMGKRCKAQSLVDENWCPKDKQQLLEGFAKNVTGNRKSGEIFVQIEPQKYNLTLRPGQPVSFNFTFKISENYPVDIYFLLDASKNFKTYNKLVVEQSTKIYDAMRKMTENIYLGVGTFVDKNTLPYTRYVYRNESYSFQHLLNFTSDHEKLKVIEKIKYGVNLDQPESGFDGIAQAIACKHFGWRDKSAKILAYMSDGPVHIAGDGRLANIYQPYDGQCYMENNRYKNELTMDYPTVGAINKLASDKEVIILFIVKYQNLYEPLTRAIRGSRVLQLHKDTKIDVELSNIYKEITTNIKLKVNMKLGRLKNYDYKFQPDCTVMNPACKIVNGQKHNFKGTFTLLEYYGPEKNAIDIAIEGISEKLSLDIEVISKCPCELLSVKSEFCNHDILECGLCKCSGNRYGERCACSGDSINKNNINDNTTCFANLSANEELCSGNGNCRCGSCVCHEDYGGTFCECYNKGCLQHNGIMCNNKGKCVCEECKCDSDYTGDACECYKYDKACMAENNKICNNRGTCECGKCSCYNKAKWDMRYEHDDFCAMQPFANSHNLQCTYIAECVTCILDNSYNCDMEDRPCHGINVTVVERLPDDLLNNTDLNLCSDVRVDLGCITQFLYLYDDDNYWLLVTMQTEKKCAQKHYFYGGICLLSLILIGIFTLIAWKVITEASYRREYLKFVQEHEADLSGPMSNPLYQPATTTFKNPAFRKRSINR